jgi:hypothetical protein
VEVRRRPAFVGACAACLVVLALAPLPAHATFPGQEGKIAFHSNRDGNTEIYTMNPDGSSQTRLTNNAASDLTPAWSPDGTKIAFVSTRDGNLEIYTMNANGSSQTRITTNAIDDAQPEWSPDGTQLAFTSNRDGNYEIYKMNADGTGIVRLTNNASGDGFAAWSPDGTKIAFQSNRDGDYDIYKMNPDGTAQTNLTNNTAFDEFPNWDSRGAHIFYDTDTDGHFDIWSMDAIGNVYSSVGSANPDFAASPSPASVNRYAYSSTRSGNTDIYKLNLSNFSDTRLTTATGADEYPDWQPVVHNYARPRGAGPLRISLVPAYQPCDPNGTPPNATHGGTINSLACVPPTPESTYLTVGTPDFNGAGANNIGSVIFSVRTITPEDIMIAVSDTDVRCLGTGGGCPSGALSDYADDLRFDTTFRITDKGNGGVGSGTVVDLPLRFNILCATTASTTVGSTCSTNTTVNTLLGASAITDGRRAIWQLNGDVKLYDGGADGVASTTADNKLFQVGGLFAP